MTRELSIAERVVAARREQEVADAGRDDIPHQTTDGKTIRPRRGNGPPCVVCRRAMRKGSKTDRHYRCGGKELYNLQWHQQQRDNPPRQPRRGR